MLAEDIASVPDCIREQRGEQAQAVVLGNVIRAEERGAAQRREVSQVVPGLLERTAEALICLDGIEAPAEFR